MRKALELGAFSLGAALLVVAFGVGWAHWWASGNTSTVMAALVVAILVTIGFLALMAGASKGKDRSVAMLVDGVLLSGLSVVFFDIGLFFLPLALVLIVFSVVKLKRDGRQIGYRH